MKQRLLIALCAAILLALAAFVGSGYRNGRRAEHSAAVQRRAVHSLTQQELAAAVARCDAPPGPGRQITGPARGDAAYCEDVAREMDDRPLEIVDQKRPTLRQVAPPAPR